MIIIKEIDDNINKDEYCQLLKNLTTINSDNIDLDIFKNQINIIKSNPYHKIYLAYDDNKIIGSITVIIEPKIIHDISFVSHIEDVVVDNNYQGKGIGRKLIEYAIDISKSYKCYKIILDCDKDKTKFYEKNGFKIKGNEMAIYF